MTQVSFKNLTGRQTYAALSFHFSMCQSPSNAVGRSGRVSLEVKKQLGSTGGTLRAVSNWNFGRREMSPGPSVGLRL